MKRNCAERSERSCRGGEAGPKENCASGEAYSGVGWDLCGTGCEMCGAVGRVFVKLGVGLVRSRVRSGWSKSGPVGGMSLGDGGLGLVVVRQLFKAM